MWTYQLLKHNVAEMILQSMRNVQMFELLDQCDRITNDVDVIDPIITKEMKTQRRYVYNSSKGDFPVMVSQCIDHNSSKRSSEGFHSNSSLKLLALSPQ